MVVPLKHLVHVEVCLHPRATAHRDQIKQAVSGYLSTARSQQRLVAHSTIEDFILQDDPILRQQVQRIIICEIEGAQDGHTMCEREDAEFMVHVYKLYEQEETFTAQDDVELNEPKVVMTREFKLPSVHTESLWDNLHYETELKQQLLHYISSAMLFADVNVNDRIINFNRMVLLYGPPGTGKTSLCKALAHKIAIRTGHRYTRAKWIEVNAHSLFSKFFSESGKTVMRLFQSIWEDIKDQDVFVCLLLDEVESLAMARSSGAGGTEPQDAVRVVNVLLTQLDRMKELNNVLIMATSNLSESIDVAFLDRADLKVFVGPPPPTAIYAILVSCLRELMRVDIIYPAVRLMDVNEVKLFYGHYQERTVSEERMSDPNEYLWWISHQCRGMSRPKVDCQTFLGALSKTIQSEQRNRVQRPSTSSSLAIMS